MKLLLRQGLRHHLRHPLRTLLTLLGIAAGTALACAVQLAQGTAEQAFDQALAAVAGQATHSVEGPAEGLPAAAYAALRRALPGTAVAPVVTAIARRADAAERTVLRVLGVDPFADPGLRPWAAPGPGSGGDLPVAALLTEPGAFVATPALLAQLGLATGDELPLRIGGRPVVGRCRGALAAPPLQAQGLADVLLVDLATAQEWSGRPDRLDRLDLRVPDGAAAPDEAALLAAVAAAGGPGARLHAAGARQGGLARLARGFRVNLTALSLLSLLVGGFLAHETLRLSVAARRREFGVLRALGASGGRLGRAVLAEALAIGLVGSAAGAGLGVLFAAGLLSPLVRTLNDHYATFALPALQVAPGLLAAALGLGTLTCLVSSIGPAWSASRVAPREVLVPARAAGERRLGALAWLSLPAFGAAALLLAGADELVRAYLGVLALLLGAVLLCPAAMVLLLAGAARVAAARGPLWRYVVRSTAAARQHLALPVAAMVVAVAATLGLATLVQSFRGSVADWLQQVLPADVYAAVPGGIDERAAGVLEPALVEALAALPGVAGATRFHRVRALVRAGGRQGELDVVGLDATPRVLGSFPLLQGEAAAARAALREGRGLWVSEPLATRWQLRLGDRVEFAAASGFAGLPVAAIYRDYANERGEVLCGAAWFLQQGRAGVTALALEAAPGAAPEALLAAAQARAAAGEQTVAVRGQRELREGSLEIFDRTFALTGTMRLFCLLVAFCGIYSAFGALQLERAAEIGLLRAIGARPGQVAILVLGQTVLLGAIAGLLALPLGAVLGHVLAQVVNTVSFGWSLPHVAVPPRAVVEALLTAVAAAALAGLGPARRFARLRPAEALREG